MTDDIAGVPVPSPAAALRDLPVVVPPVPEVHAPPLHEKGMGRNDPDRVTPQELRFIAEYLQDQDGPRAVRAAGYHVSNDASARAQAVKTLARPRVAKQIQARLDRLLIAADVTAEKVMREFARVGFADPLDLFEPSGESGRFRFKPIDAWPERARSAVASVKVGKMKDADGEYVETLEVKFWPKVQALEALAKRIEVLVQKFGTGEGGDVHLHKHDGAQVTMYFPENGRGHPGPNPTNRSVALTYRQPTVEGEGDGQEP